MSSKIVSDSGDDPTTMKKGIWWRISNAQHQRNKSHVIWTHANSKRLE